VQDVLKPPQHKKLESKPVEAATGCASTTNRLFVTDITSKLKYLVDSGADISVVPPSNTDKQQRSNTLKLYAANGTAINTYGMKTITLNLGLRRPYCWPFVIADVTKPIIGADLLKHFGLLVDLNNNRLIDNLTKLTRQCSKIECSSIAIKTIQKSHPYASILSEFPLITKPFSRSLAVSHDVVHYITTSGTPCSAKPRRLPPDRLEIAKREFKNMVELGICRPSSSSWASPLHLIEKADGGWRPCGDYRALNSKTVADNYPVPHIHDVSYILQGKNCFSKIDLKKAYHQIPVVEYDIPKTAVSTPFGLFEFVRMPFGLRNAGQTFQRFMHKVLEGLEYCFPYMDDVLVASESKLQHEDHLRTVFERLDRFGLLLNVNKCIFGVEQIDFLGYSIGSTGTKPLPQKVQAILDYKKPHTVKELRKFLGMINFYRHFLPNAAENQIPLLTYQKGNKKNDRTEIKWNEATEGAFQACKTSLANAVLLAHPRSSAPLAVKVDASDFAVGGVLEQQEEENQNWRPLAFFSKKLSTAQQKYSTYDRELLAIYLTIKQFKHMLQGRHFIVWTDHKPLTYAFNQRLDKCSPRQFRHLDYIGQFTTEIKHIPGKQNVTADLMSRIEQINVNKLNYEEISNAQEEDQELKNLLNGSTSLKLSKVELPESKISLVCDTSTGVVRPYIPVTHRKLVFDIIHGLSHPGCKATTKLIKAKFVWANVNKDVAFWVKNCIPCQASKISRHVVTAPASFTVPAERFRNIHIDLVGPLPSCQGYRYCLTCVDRYTRWPEVLPIQDIAAETVAKALYTGWITRFGVPEVITTDQGTQFESLTFNNTIKLLGIKRVRTTAYHPQTNGLVERLHRQLKAAIKCYNSQNWVDIIPSVLFGMRNSMKEDINTTSAELVYGCTLRLPGEFITPGDVHEDQGTYAAKLRFWFDQLRPTSTSAHGKKNIFVYKDLSNANYVFLRKDHVKKPLERPYDGPFKVLDRTSKTITLQIGNKEKKVSMDRVKPAYIEAPAQQPLNQGHISQTLPIRTGPSQNQSPQRRTEEKADAPPDQKTTRSGRPVRLPVRFRN